MQLFKEKCDQFDKCIDHLYTQANGILIGSTKDVHLKQICSFLARSSNTSDNCKRDDRHEISKFLNQRMTSNSTFKSCWESRVSTPFDNVCSDVQASSIVCKVNGTHRIAREFVNRQLRNLDCGCRELNETQKDTGTLSIPLVIGACVGGFLLLATLFAVCFIWYRRKSVKNKKSHPTPDGYSKYGAADVNYEDHLYYQIDDKAVPPTLPPRNVNMIHNKSINQPMDEPDYLVPAVGKNQSMEVADYLVPEMNRVQSSQYSTPYFNETGDSGYFIPLPPTDDEEGRQVSEIKT
ncbi:uncharacterized protein LOC131927855 isoform X2 [Physella acuta]|uniref:uncharacterized protein LOC131927855 isoform X2 n=1 Tax=Physella acuta TaxID=109671 RepID=UPI0027DD3ACD|nr:uncharacterized protein LOC131927855 isoform X2 [Physella acuta]